MFASVGVIFFTLPCEEVRLGIFIDPIVVKINCLRKIKEKKKRSNTQIKNTRIYVVRQYAYIHRRWQGESFTKKIRSYNSGTRTLSKNPNPKYILTSLTPRINQEKTFL